MFGLFKPTAPLSGGLLWKIPWRMSAPQKLRQRRRLRHVDNVVTVLSSALSRQKALAVDSNQSSREQTQQDQTQHEQPSVEESLTAHLDPSQTTLTPDQLARRHHKGPKRGDFLPGTPVLLSDVAKQKGTIRLLERWKAEMPTEAEMLPKDKYTMFDRKAKRYRKGVHKLPKWTRVSQRLNPPGF